MNISAIIVGFVTMIIGILLIPLVAFFTATAKANASVASISGLPTLMDLIPYMAGFVVIGVGVGMIIAAYTGKL